MFSIHDIFIGSCVALAAGSALNGSMTLSEPDRIETSVVHRGWSTAQAGEAFDVTCEYRLRLAHETYGRSYRYVDVVRAGQLEYSTGGTTLHVYPDRQHAAEAFGQDTAYPVAAVQKRCA